MRTLPAALLVAIHDEVLAGIEQRLPPEMRVLNAALLETNGWGAAEPGRLTTALRGWDAYMLRA